MFTKDILHSLISLFENNSFTNQVSEGAMAGFPALPV